MIEGSPCRSLYPFRLWQGEVRRLTYLCEESKLANGSKKEIPRPMY